MKRISIAALLAWAVMGCSPQHGMHYTVLIDNAMTGDQVGETMDAAISWETAVPGLTFDYVITHCEGYEDKDHTICVFLDPGDPAKLSSGDNPHALATTDFSHGLLSSSDSASADSATMHLWASTIDGFTGPDAFRNIVAHELGHAMTHDSSHIMTGEHLMQPASAASVLLNITPADVDYFWAAR